MATAAGAPAARKAHARTATDLAHTVAAAGGAINALGGAHADQLFIDHFTSAYANPRANADFARNRIATHLTAARTALAEATSMLRSGATSADLAEQRVLAARRRSPQTVSAAPGQSSPPPAESPAPAPPNPGRRR
ncbi:hypothetical protein [Streptomyces camelliae]|uniref:Uncharacterized protein n=1 Tax=Streptomyces camelliae TaxID=3004093 RepID=A0ABY7PBE7_9ACTN|nr:hypothetical protein [Streptomyces sp. HUAS 2-6]WBO65598.1 hypothetical protein O1G22_23660 [Streptomyces sp. HUAS 2-6]